MNGPRIPVSTYRLQFNQQLRFNDARQLVPYLSSLGITDIYASPLLQAKRGSLHGYDVADPSHLNPELGTDEEFDAFVHELHAHGMGLVLDIVPNHMSAGSENPWWMDLLEDGPRSVFASYFDVDWHPPNRSLDNRVLLPILGTPYAESLEKRELRLSYARTGFYLTYSDFTLPIATRTYNRILGYRQDRLERVLGSSDRVWQEFQGIQAAIAQIPAPGNISAEGAGEQRQHREGIKERLWLLYTTSPEVKRFIDGNLRLFNGRKGVPATFLLLEQLLTDQAYALAFWRTANQEINYRRFFTISDLVGLRVEDPMAFEAIHAVVLRLAAKGLVTGFRIDHIDGLRDPLGYLRRLQERTQPENGARPRNFYVVVEKILSLGESLPAEWPVHGTTGYDFMNALNGLFIEASNLPALEATYSQFIGNHIRYPDLKFAQKKLVMDSLLAVEMRTLGRYLSVLATHDRYARDLSREELTRALVETTACLEPYRTYIRSFEVKAQDRQPIEKALRLAQQRNPSIAPACFRFLREILLLQHGAHLLPEQGEWRLAFVMTWQQYTGPITAKGVEDSALYIYNRLVSMNEVGGSPQCGDLSIGAFDSFLEERHKKWPFGMNTTMTHDAKRSEDVRARINVLSELPEEWTNCLNNWSQWNEGKRRRVNGVLTPEPNEEILLYQILLGSWPVGGAICACYTRRIQDFMVKAMREAMVHTKWTVPNLEHEQALMHFVEDILTDRPENHFLADFRRFAAKIALHGAFNSLSQLVIKLAAPGVADFYQGTEMWDLRLVDPDNRQPVDFANRTDLLRELEGGHSPENMAADWQDGRIKMHITHRGLQFRKHRSSLFLKGTYVPLQTKGDRANNIIGFARRYRGDWMVVIVPRFTTRLIEDEGRGLSVGSWRDTAVVLPKDAPAQWVNIFDQESWETHDAVNQTINVDQILQSFPVALLSSEPFPQDYARRQSETTSSNGSPLNRIDREPRP